MNKKLIAKVLIIIIFIAQIGYYLSLILAGYFYLDTFFLSNFFLLILPFSGPIYVIIKFGDTYKAKFGLVILCLLLGFASLNFRLIPHEVYMKPYIYRCKYELNYQQLDEFRKSIEYKYNSGTLQLKKDDNHFWGALHAYIADSEKNDYINDNFIEVGFKLKDEKIDKIFFIRNKNLWGIIYISPENFIFTRKHGILDFNETYKDSRIFGNYIGFKR